MQTLELLRENLDVLYRAVHDHPESALIEETGRMDDDEYYSVYELHDELFLFHFSKKTICQLILFENVPAALAYLRKVTQS
ncbi:hypothetical protein JNM05_10730 [bacterium]|nr:hypothetical protein [bacterium]